MGVPVLNAHRRAFPFKSSAGLPASGLSGPIARAECRADIYLPPLNNTRCYMRLALLFVTILVVANSAGRSQAQSSASEAGFDEYSIQDFGTILIADIMELQGGKFREFAKQYQEKTGMRVVDSNLATFQQKGVNDFTAEGRTTYARVMVQTIFNQAGEIFKTDELSTLSAKDLSDFDGETKAGILRDVQAANVKVLSWYGTVVSRIGTYRALHTSYLRQFGTKPSVRVDEYIFFNHDRIHKISISYRVEDKSIWEERLHRTLDSIRITLVK